MCVCTCACVYLYVFIFICVFACDSANVGYLVCVKVRVKTNVRHDSSHVPECIHAGEVDMHLPSFSRVHESKFLQQEERKK